MKWKEFRQLYKINFLIILILLLLNSCDDNPKVKVEYFSNGETKSKTYKINDNGDYVFFGYDSIGRVESVITYHDRKMDGPFKYFYDLPKYRCEVGGIYVHELGIKQYEKLYFLKSSKLYSEVHFIKLGSCYWDNSHISYDENGKLMVEKSCYTEISSNKDSLKVGEDYVINFNAPCFDFERTELCIGDFNENYAPNSKKTDTFFSNDQYISYKIHTTKPGEKIIRGYIKRFNVESTGDTNSKEAKKLYFSRQYFVHR